jgi:hypothetical protein
LSRISSSVAGRERLGLGRAPPLDRGQLGVLGVVLVLFLLVGDRRRPGLGGLLRRGRRVVVVVVVALERGAALGLARGLRAVRAAALREREAGLQVRDELFLRPQHLLVRFVRPGYEVVAGWEGGGHRDLVVSGPVLFFVVFRAAAEAAAH